MLQKFSRGINKVIKDDCEAVGLRHLREESLKSNRGYSYHTLRGHYGHAIRNVKVAKNLRNSYEEAWAAFKKIRFWREVAGWVWADSSTPNYLREGQVHWGRDPSTHKYTSALGSMTQQSRGRAECQFCLTWCCITSSRVHPGQWGLPEHWALLNRAGRRR